jgi:hypothetical protein
MITFEHTAKPKYSIWGKVDDAEQIMAGVWQVHTAGHGGLIVSAKRLQYIPKSYLDASFNRQGHDGNFEEDCDMAIPLVTFEYEYRQYLEAKGLSADKINERMVMAHRTLNEWILNRVTT